MYHCIIFNCTFSSFKMTSFNIEHKQTSIHLLSFFFSSKQSHCVKQIINYSQFNFIMYWTHTKTSIAIVSNEIRVMHCIESISLYLADSINELFDWRYLGFTNHQILTKNIIYSSSLRSDEPIAPFCLHSGDHLIHRLHQLNG